MISPGLVRAAAKSAAVENRSAGSLARAFVTVASTCGGTDGRSTVKGAGIAVRILATTAWADAPTNGGVPASISYNVAPSEYTSLRPSNSRSAEACSGLM